MRGLTTPLLPLLGNTLRHLGWVGCVWGGGAPLAAALVQMQSIHHCPITIVAVDGGGHPRWPALLSYVLCGGPRSQHLATRTTSACARFE